jgi:tetratricopeptide (TPR) repeat protein
MKRQFANPPVYLVAAALCLLLFAHVCARDASEQWTRTKSKNFLLVGNASEEEIRQVAARLEQFREVFTRLLPIEHFDSSVPTTVMVFKSDAAYKPFEPLYDGKPAGVAGFFQSNPDVDYITLSVDRRGMRKTDALAFHEYVHLLVRNNFRNAPLWFNEGLAEYYSTFEVSDGNRKVKLGKAIKDRVRALRGRELLPLEVLFSVDEKSAHYNEPDKRRIFYAESWALVHYLLSNERRPQLSTFLDLLAKGTGLEDSFKQAFQTSFEGLESELREYIRRNEYRQQVMIFDERLEFDSWIKSAPLTEAEAEFYLGDLLLHTNRLDEADAYLQRAVTLDPRLASAHASLGVLRVRQNRLDAAREHLKLASAANPNNYLVHYYHAYVLSRAPIGSDDLAEGYFDTETATLMRAELKKAIELAPNFAEAYRLLAFVNIARDEHVDDAIQLLKQAIRLSPRRKDFALLMAQAHMRKEEFDTAREILNAVARGNVSRSVREQAQALLAIVKSREEFAARVKAMNEMAMKAETPPGPVQPCDAPQPGPQLKKLRFSGEQVCGMLVRVECADDGGVILYVETGERTFRLHSASLNRIRFVTYTAEVRGHVTCGLREPASPVLITYKPATDARAAGVDGEAIAVEFVPRDWNANH